MDVQICINCNINISNTAALVASLKILFLNLFHEPLFRSAWNFVQNIRSLGGVRFN